MKDKRAALYVLILIALMLVIAGALGISEIIPFIGKGISLVLAIIMIVLVIGIFVLILRRRDK